LQVDPAFYKTWQEQWIEAKTSLQVSDRGLLYIRPAWNDVKQQQ
jgi:hypothetical protein